MVAAAVEAVTIDQILDISECKPIRFAAGSDVRWEIKREAKNEPKIFGWSYWVN